MIVFVTLRLSAKKTVTKEAEKTGEKEIAPEAEKAKTEGKETTASVRKVVLHTKQVCAAFASSCRLYCSIECGTQSS